MSIKKQTIANLHLADVGDVTSSELHTPCEATFATLSITWSRFPRY